MKQFHEVAKIVKAGVPVAYLVQDTYTLSDPTDMKLRTTLPYREIEVIDFVELVRQNKVQYLTLENNTAVCRLTDEERRVLINSKIKKDFVSGMEQDYWAKDTAFDRLHIDLAKAGRALALAACNIVSVLGLKYVLFSAYGSEDVIESLLRKEDRLKNMGAFVSIQGSNHFAFMILASEPAVVRFFNELNELTVPAIITTDTLANTFGDRDIKAGLFIKAVGNKKYSQLISILNDITRPNLNSLAVDHPSGTSQGATKTSCFGTC